MSLSQAQEGMISIELVLLGQAHVVQRAPLIKVVSV